MSSADRPSECRLIDLHVHTTASDGSLSPAECVEEAARTGLAAIAITDHDTLAGNAEAQARGAERGVEVVPGVELSSEHGSQVVHLLGYYPEPGAPELDALIARVQDCRRERNPRILERLAELGCPVDAEELASEAGSGVIGRPHIAALMVRKGHVRSLDEAFRRYLGQGAAAYVERRKVDAAESIAALLAARAVPVLAHPGSPSLFPPGSDAALVGALVEMGLRGVEAHYHAHHPQQVAEYRRLAQRYGLVVTGGSDFHGAATPDIQMGRGLGGLRVPYEALERLKRERDRLARAT